MSAQLGGHGGRDEGVRPVHQQTNSHEKHDVRCQADGTERLVHKQLCDIVSVKAVLSEYKMTFVYHRDGDDEHHGARHSAHSRCVA